MENEESLGCAHYKRNCAFITPCCKKLYPCRVCHDESEVHQIDRHAVQEVECLSCHTRQKVSNSCLKCEVQFGRYFCAICRLYDLDDSKGQFHCDKCGICRVGGRSKFFHCDKCDSCLAFDVKDTHKCLEKATHSNCPICLEDLHTSRKPISVPRCSHFIHSECMEAMFKNGNYSCGICGESFNDMQSVWQMLDDEVENSPMPDDYRDFYVQILCKDCHKESRVLFHVVGLKCQECGSYNTCRTADTSETTGSSDSINQSAGPEPTATSRVETAAPPIEENNDGRTS